MGDGLQRRGGARLAIAGILASLAVGSLATVPAAASTGIGVWVGYADSLRAEASNFPTPWDGSPQTIFRGCSPATACVFDAGRSASSTIPARP